MKQCGLCGTILKHTEKIAVHRESPECSSARASPAITSLIESLPPALRKRAVAELPWLSATSKDGLDESRRFAVGEWVFRTALPAMLDVAGLTEHGEAMRALHVANDLATGEAAREIAAKIWETSLATRRRLPHVRAYRVREIRKILDGAKAARWPDSRTKPRPPNDMWDLAITDVYRTFENLCEIVISRKIDPAPTIGRLSQSSFLLFGRIATIGYGLTESEVHAVEKFWPEEGLVRLIRAGKEMARNEARRASEALDRYGSGTT